MTALTQDRNTTRRDGIDFVFPVAADARIYVGALVAINATGYAVPGTGAGTLQGVGIAQERAMNLGGDDGEITVKVRRGCFLLDNSATTPLVRTSIGTPCYIEDDRTVGANASTCIAGIVRDVDSEGVWVEF
jgi:hypothetical protein